MFKKIKLEYFLYLFVFLLPLQTRWIVFDPKINGGVWEYGRISIYGFDVVFITLLLVALATIPTLRRDKSGAFNYFITLLLKKNYKLQITSYRLLIIIISLFLYFFISLLFIADNKLIAAYWSLRILQGILLIWLISKINFSKIHPVNPVKSAINDCNTAKLGFDRVKLAWALVSGVTLSAILGIYQFLFQSTFASKWLGLAYHSATIFGDSVVETTSGRWLRAYGAFPHPNVLAGFIVIAIIFCIWLLSLKHPSASLRTGLNTKTPFGSALGRLKHTLLKTLLITYYLLLTACLFFTFSRAAWLIFLLFTIYYLLITFKKKNISLFLYFFISLFLFISLSIFYYPLLNTRLQNTARLEIKSNIERISGYQESLQIIKTHPLFGVGIGNYTNELQKISPNKPAWAYQPVHNVYLLALAEIGIIGIIIITLLLYYFIKKNYVKRNRDYVIPYFLFLIPLFLFFFDHYFWTLASAFLLIWTIIGLFVKNNNVYDKKTSN